MAAVTSHENAQLTLVPRAQGAFYSGGGRSGPILQQFRPKSVLRVGESNVCVSHPYSSWNPKIYFPNKKTPANFLRRSAASRFTA